MSYFYCSVNYFDFYRCQYHYSRLLRKIITLVSGITTKLNYYSYCFYYYYYFIFIKITAIKWTLLSIFAVATKNEFYLVVISQPVGSWSKG
jgi:hypothetical protein